MAERRRLPDGLRPFEQPDFRRIWSASILSNLAQQVQAVSAAWSLVEIGASPGMVSLVQTATMVPIMLLALPGGAIADMFDRRKAALAALSLVAIGAITLAFLSSAGLTTPHILLACCFVVGVGLALFIPAWQASINELVPRDSLPAAVGLYGMSSNAARSVGPAVGGLIVATFGASIAFAINVLLYLPIIIALLLWKRVAESSRLPPEGIFHAVRSGMRYVRYSPPLRRMLVRATVSAVGGSAVYALLPMVARDLLHGDARTYGILLGCFGMGAIGIAPTIPRIRRNASPERIVMTSSVTHGSAILVIAISPFQFLSMAALAVAGASWLIIMSTYNLGIQMAAPRWVTGRAVAAFQATVSGSLALGAAIWGQLSNLSSIISSLEVAGILLLLTPIIGRFLPLPAIEQDDLQSVPARGKPDTQLNMTGRSGPLTVEVEYCIEVEHARAFYHLALQVQRMRGRNGAYGPAIARDVSQPTRWVERFHYPTWDDYRRARERPTRAERDLNQSLLDMQSTGQPLIVRRLLERPFGSVRWRDSSRDDKMAPPPTDGPL